uniref:5-hydroxytryptamine receptor 3D n=1 Tax=Panthera tigris altaica TaxID=74533 RepID=A0A8C9JKG4_PANTA
VQKCYLAPSPDTLLTGSLLSSGRGDTFTINCSGFDRHGVDPVAFQAVFDRKAFRPVINYSIPTRVNISFTMSAIVEVVSPGSTLQCFWYNPFITWNPEECGGIKKISIAAENLWLPDIFIEEQLQVSWFMSTVKVSSNMISQCGWSASVTWTSSISPLMNRTWRTCSWAWRRNKGEWVLLDIHQRMMKMTVGTNQYDQIIFYVAIRRRPRLYVINLLVPSGFLVAIDALSFYLPIESENRAPFKMTLLLGYNVFLLMMNDLLPATGTPLISMDPLGKEETQSVYFALCLSLMVVSLLETIFITYLLHLATTQPPPMPQWLHSLLLYCTSPTKCCPTAPQKGNKGLGLTPTHLPGVKEPVELVGKVPGPREAELNGCPGSTRAQQEYEAQKRHLVNLWIEFSHMMDTLLFRLYLLFMATSIITVIVLWNT